MEIKTPKKEKIVLLDTHAIIHRAYHALPEFTNSKGEPTGALYGLSTMLFKIISELKPDYIVACYDLPKKTFRHEAYEGYKAGRAKADESLVAQIISSRNFFQAFSIPIYECEGFEADDLLGTISNKLISKSNVDVIIASGDMDTLQLVRGESVLVYTLKKGVNDTILYNESKVFERFGFEPKFLPDYKGLRGDPSDNIIGIKGIGEKTATTLISHYHTIENMYESIDKGEDELKKLGITPRVFSLLKEGKEEALFSKTLATIRTDAPIDFRLPEKKWEESVDKEKVAQLFRDLEFKSLQARFLNIFDGDNKNTEKQNVEKFSSFTPEGTYADKIFQHSVLPENLQKAKIAFWLLNSEHTNPTSDDILNYKKSNSFEEAFSKLEEDIKKENLSYIYEQIEIPIINIIDEMEKNGILIDKKYLSDLSKEYHTDLDKLEKEIWQEAGVQFNINSPKQLSEVLFEKLALSPKGIKKSAGGSLSTRESELDKLRELHPVVAKIIEYREFQKLLSTYIDTIPDLVSTDGRLHANFIQTGTTTGRFASSNPNLQNIPIKTERGKNIRNAFIASSGNVLASFDYSQIELRVAALMSQDKYFIEAFNQGRDIHSAVAMKVFSVPEEEVTYDMRRRAKIINFGILYGMGVTALKDNLGTDRKDAQIFYDNYFAQFPTIAGYLESIKNFAKQHGYTETLFGRKRYFPGVRSPIPYIKAMALRMATNAPIQGTATADIIKIGMKKVDDVLVQNNLKKDVKLVLQIHDELIYEIKKDKVKEVMKLIENAMVDVIPKEFLKDKESVPLLVSSSFGTRWGDLK